jgi:hypothetical protein
VGSSDVTGFSDPPPPGTKLVDHEMNANPVKAPNGP